MIEHRTLVVVGLMGTAIVLVVGGWARAEDAPAPERGVAVRTHVEVRGDYVPLAACLDAGALDPELAAEAETLFVGPSPVLHEVRRVPVSAIRSALRKLGDAAAAIRLLGPEEIEVVRVSADDAGTQDSVEGAWIRAIREYGASRPDLASAELAIQILDCRPTLTWIGPDALKIEQFRPVQEETLGRAVRYAGQLQGGPDGPVLAECTARVSAYKSVCVAARPLRFGEICRAGDGVLRRVALVEGECYVANPGELPGQKVIQGLAAGEPITAGHLQPPPCVKAREEVTVVMERGGARLVTHGIAQKEGAPGDVIPVLNPNTKKTFQARVMGPGQVETLR